MTYKQRRQRDLIKAGNMAEGGDYAQSQQFGRQTSLAAKRTYWRVEERKRAGSKVKPVTKDRREGTLGVSVRIRYLSE